MSCFGTYVRVSANGSVQRGTKATKSNGQITSNPQEDEIFELSYGPYEQGSLVRLKSVKYHIYLTAAHKGIQTFLYVQLL